MKVGVEIEINKGGDEIGTYWGMISVDDLEAIRTGTCTKTFVELSDVYWITEEWDEGVRTHRRTTLGETPPYEGHEGTLFFRPSQVVLFMLLQQTTSL